jgi:hypothetical protein
MEPEIGHKDHANVEVEGNDLIKFDDELDNMVK